MSYYPGYPYGYGYPYSYGYGYPYGYGYGYPYGYPYRYGYPYYSFASLSNDYKLNGLYNELDELNEIEANALSKNRDVSIDTSMNHDLHGQLKNKNYELVQHIVGKNKEINELKELLKKNNIEYPNVDNIVDCSMNPRYFFPHKPYPYPHPHHPHPHHPHPHPHHPHPHPYWLPLFYDKNKHREGMNETHAGHAAHVIIPRAIEPNYHSPHYDIPPHEH